jgi:uncharacterized oligopeptide transporter (OPT) family protein
MLSAVVEVLRSEKIMRAWAAVKSLPAYWDEFLYAGGNKGPTLLGTSLKDLTIRFDSSVVFIATGGLMGIRTGVSLLIGGVLNYVILAPWLISKGIILPGKGGAVGFKEITLWALWGGVACMTTSSLYSFFSKPKVILQAFAGMFAKKAETKRDILEHIELPVRFSILGIPVLGVIIILLGHAWFGISYGLGALAIPLVFVFSLIATNATGLTSITPTGAMAKLTQLTYGVLAPKNITTNLMTAGITAEVASNTANLLMDIKPGYMLGGKPRHQAIGHCLGTISGVILSVPIWYLFLVDGDIGRYGSEQLPVPSAIVWKAVAEVLMKGLGFLHPTAQYAVVVGAIIGVVLEVAKQVTKGKFPLSGVGIGLAFVLRFADIWTMFLGSFLFWLIERRARSWSAPEPPDQKDYRTEPAKLAVRRPWYVLASDNSETICAGVIAGGALMGIAVTILELKLPDVAELHSIGKSISALLKGGR